MISWSFIIIINILIKFLEREREKRGRNIKVSSREM